MDGLTYEFYEKFWPIIKALFLKVAHRGFRQGHLPPSMLKGVVALAPKQREPSDLKNWRPITLLSTDHKLIARCLAKRITRVLPQLISSDQSYCVPGRSIHTNLQLLRDAIEYANTSAVI
jgi:hypothetical protein